MNWKGVMPAITRCFTETLRVDQGFMAEHCRWLLENGCSGIVVLGSLGEGATLSFDEKQAILRTCVEAVRGRGPVVASISALTTSEAAALAKSAADQGCDGLMVLPPYVYKGDWRAIRALVGGRLHMGVGVDDAVMEAIGVGATGSIARLANALPRESVDLMTHGINGDADKAFELYRWFLPLLRMDTVFNFVQLIKLVQAEVGMGNSRVRPPRLELAGDELSQTLKVIRAALQHRPQPAASYAFPDGISR